MPRMSEEHKGTADEGVFAHARGAHTTNIRTAKLSSDLSLFSPKQEVLIEGKADVTYDFTDHLLFLLCWQ